MEGEEFVYFTDIDGFELFERGKVRDIYRVSSDTLLFVSTDRISAFDVVFPTPIAGKGIILTKITRFWFRLIEKEGIAKTHYIDDLPDKLPAHLAQRAILGKKAEPIPVECIVRFRLLGSAWREYKEHGTVHGMRLPAGLEFGYKFEEPLFTPSTKEKDGHDRNIDFATMKWKIGSTLAEKLRKTSLELATFARNWLIRKGIELVDTKFEFGLLGDDVILIDEVFTPDSSRFWVDGEKNYDKEFLREWAKGIRWNRKYPAPWIPDDIVSELLRRYKEVERRMLSE